MNNTRPPPAKTPKDPAEVMAGTIGKTRINSTSKIRKIIAIKKNRIEKGRREINLGVNPHSNGLNFSRSREDLRPTPRPRPVSSNARTTVVKTRLKIKLNF